MNSLKIRELENRIVEILNENPSPLEVKRLVVLEIMGKLDKAADEEIRGLMRAERLRSAAEGESIETAADIGDETRKQGGEQDE